MRSLGAPCLLHWAAWCGPWCGPWCGEFCPGPPGVGTLGLGLGSAHLKDTLHTVLLYRDTEKGETVNTD